MLYFCKTNILTLTLISDWNIMETRATALLLMLWSVPSSPAWTESRPAKRAAELLDGGFFTFNSGPYSPSFKSNPLPSHPAFHSSYREAIPLTEGPLPSLQHRARAAQLSASGLPLEFSPAQQPAQGAAQPFTVFQQPRGGRNLPVSAPQPVFGFSGSQLVMKPGSQVTGGLQQVTSQQQMFQGFPQFQPFSQQQVFQSPQQKVQHLPLQQFRPQQQQFNSQQFQQFEPQQSIHPQFQPNQQVFQSQNQQVQLQQRVTQPQEQQFQTFQEQQFQSQSQQQVFELSETS